MSTNAHCRLCYSTLVYNLSWLGTALLQPHTLSRATVVAIVGRQATWELKGHWFAPPASLFCVQKYPWAWYLTPNPPARHPQNAFSSSTDYSPHRDLNSWISFLMFYLLQLWDNNVLIIKKTHYMHKGLYYYYHQKKNGENSRCHSSPGVAFWALFSLFVQATIVLWIIKQGVCC